MAESFSFPLRGRPEKIDVHTVGHSRHVGTGSKQGTDFPFHALVQNRYDIAPAAGESPERSTSQLLYRVQDHVVVGNRADVLGQDHRNPAPARHVRRHDGAHVEHSVHVHCIHGVEDLIERAPESLRIEQGKGYAIFL